jgi:hypothetical protein
MAREIMPIRLPDPEVLEAQDSAKKLFQEYRECTDSLMIKVFKEMVFDALEFEAEARLRSRARNAVEMLHELQKPLISEN